jgi:hypothetical protein
MVRITRSAKLKTRPKGAGSLGAVSMDSAAGRRRHNRQTPRPEAPPPVLLDT